MYRGLCSCSNLHELQTYGNIKEDKHTFQLSIVLLINSIPSSCRPSISITCARACVAHVSLGTSSRPQNINTILITQQSVVRCSYCLEMNVTFAMGALIGILIRTLFSMNTHQGECLHCIHCIRNQALIGRRVLGQIITYGTCKKILNTYSIYSKYMQ